MTPPDSTFPCRVTADLRESPSTVGTALIGPTDDPLIKERWERATLLSTCNEQIWTIPGRP